MLLVSVCCCCCYSLEASDMLMGLGLGLGLTIIAVAEQSLPIQNKQLTWVRSATTLHCATVSASGVHHYAVPVAAGHAGLLCHPPLLPTACDGSVPAPSTLSVLSCLPRA
jgi:hypothetical protein